MDSKLESILIGIDHKINTHVVENEHTSRAQISTSNGAETQ